MRIYIVLFVNILMFNMFFISEAIASNKINQNYFGMHVIKFHDSTFLPFVSYNSVRLWDSGTTWAHIQPAKESFNWTRLDSAVDSVFVGKDIMLTLGMTPLWATSAPEASSFYGNGMASMPLSIEDWENYVAAVLNRYGNKITALEVWNEPDSSGFFKGSMADLVTLTKSVRTVVARSNQNVLIVSPSFSDVKKFEEYISLGAADYVDVFSFHLYSYNPYPEAVIDKLAQLRAVLDKYGIRKPIWNTESGYDLFSTFPVKCSDTTMSLPAFISRWYLQLASNGVERFYWYAWDHKTLGFLDAYGKLRGSSAYFSYISVRNTFLMLRKWLINNQIDTCQLNATGLWSCDLLVGDKKKQLLWADNKMVNYVSATPKKFTWVDGTSKTSVTKVAIGVCPVLVE